MANKNYLVDKSNQITNIDDYLQNISDNPQQEKTNEILKRKRQNEKHNSINISTDKDNDNFTYNEIQFF